jgi:hypothetical protein
MAWPAPKPADIVWCYVPYEQADGSTSLVRHPALVVAVDSAKSRVQVVVMGGTSYRKTEWSRIKRACKAWDLLLETTDPWFAATGLSNDTLFHLERRYVLPYTPEYFFAPSGGSPKLGVLDGSHPALLEKYRRASLAAQAEQLKRSH